MIPSVSHPASGNDLSSALKAVDAIQQRIGQLCQSGEQIGSRLQNLEAESRKINEVAEVISSIAKQTLMVSFNASIESARASEQGAAFAVVATEVGELARKVQTASESVSQLTDENYRALSDIRNATNQLLQGLEGVREDGKALNREFSRLAVGSSGSGGKSNDFGSAEKSEELVFDPETMATGVSSVDHQHRKLIDAINQMERFCREGRALDEIKGLLDFMGKYVVDHFSHEEKEMERLQCPVASKNKQQHAMLVEKYLEWRKAFDQSGGSLSMVYELHAFLKEWLINHICRTDRCLKDCHTQ